MLAPCPGETAVAVNSEHIHLGLFFKFKLVEDILECDDLGLFTFFCTGIEHPISSVLLTMSAVVQVDELTVIWVSYAGYGGVLDLVKDRIPAHY